MSRSRPLQDDAPSIGFELGRSYYFWQGTRLLCRDEMGRVDQVEEGWLERLRECRIYQELETIAFIRAVRIAHA